MHLGWLTVGQAPTSWPKASPALTPGFQAAAQLGVGDSGAGHALEVPPTPVTQVAEPERSLWSASTTGVAPRATASWRVAPGHGPVEPAACAAATPSGHVIATSRARAGLLLLITWSCRRRARREGKAEKDIQSRARAPQVSARCTRSIHGEAPSTHDGGRDAIHRHGCGLVVAARSALHARARSLQVHVYAENISRRPCRRRRNLVLLPCGSKAADDEGARPTTSRTAARCRPGLATPRTPMAPWY